MTRSLMMAFSEFFRGATGHDPYPYQRRLAEADPLPQVINIPTHAGKTPAVSRLLDKTVRPSPSAVPVAQLGFGSRRPGRATGGGGGEPRRPDSEVGNVGSSRGEELETDP
jgi:hypothetical protein